MRKLTLLATLVMISSSALGAETTVSAKISTLGLGVDVAFPLASGFDGRIGINGGSDSFGNKAFVSSNGTATKYDGSVKLQTLSAIVDWRPWESAFHLSGGLMYNNNQFKLNLKPNASGSLNLGDTNYNVASGQYANAAIDFRKIAPYLGIGWGRTPKNQGFSINGDIGLLFQGKSNTSLSTNISGVTQSDINKAQSDISNEWKCSVCPVVSVGVGYTF